MAAWALRSPRASALSCSMSWTRLLFASAAPSRRSRLPRSSRRHCCQEPRISCRLYVTRPLDPFRQEKRKVTRVALEIPKIGLVMESARLIRWLKNVGDVVEQGEPLLELETEKSVVEIESTESGRLGEVLLQADQEARVGDRIAWIENDSVAAIGRADTTAAPLPGAPVGGAATQAAPT